MADVGSVEVRIDANTQGLETGIQTAQNTLASFSSNLRTLGTSLSFALTVPLGLAAKAGLAFDSSMQQAKAAFGTLLGDQARADKLVDTLREMADVTPFETTDLTQASQKLLGYGLAVEKLVPTLKMLGDVAMGNKEHFSSLSLAYSQIQATGRLMGQDLLQLVNAGFNPLQEISRKTGKSMAELKEEMSKGNITFAMVEGAFRSATSEGGRFYGSMEKMSTTFSGLMSTISDTAKTTLGAVMKPLFDVLSNSILPKFITLLKEIAEKFNSLSDGTKLAILGTGAFLAILGPLLLISGALITSFTAVAGILTAITAPVWVVVAAITALVGTFVLLWRNNVDFRNNIIALWVNISNSLKIIYNDIAEIVSAVWGWMKLYWQRWGADITEVFSVTWKFVAQVFVDVFKAIQGVFDIFAGLFTGNWSKMWSGIKMVLLEAAKGIMTILGGLDDIIPGPSLGFTKLRDSISNMIDKETVKRNTAEASSATKGFGFSLDGLMGSLKSVGSTIKQNSAPALEDFSKSLGGVKEKAASAKEVLQAAKEEVNKMGDALKAQVSNIEAYKQKSMTSLNNMGTAIATALKAQYQQEEQSQKDSYEKRIKNLKSNLQYELDTLKAANTKKLQEYLKDYNNQKAITEGKYDSQVSAAEKEIEALENKTAIEDEELKKIDYANSLRQKQQDLLDSGVNAAQKMKEVQDDINETQRKSNINIDGIKQDISKEDDADKRAELIKKQQEAEYENNLKLKELAEKQVQIVADAEKEKQKVQKELQNMADEEARRLLLRDREAQIKELNTKITNLKDNKTKELELEKETYDSKVKLAEEDLKKQEERMTKENEKKIENYQKEIEKMQEHYKTLNKEENIQAETRRLALDTDNKELIDLLTQYNPDWQNAGQTFGQKMLEGLQSMKSSIQQEVNNILSMVGQAKSAVAQNDVIIQAKQMWSSANAIGDSSGMKSASELADKARSLGGTIGANMSLSDALKVPKMATGTNYVPQDMLAYIHEGEAVVPKEYNNKGNGDTIINVNGSKDPRAVAREVVNILRLQGVRA